MLPYSFKIFLLVLVKHYHMHNVSWNCKISTNSSRCKKKLRTHNNFHVCVLHLKFKVKKIEKHEKYQIMKRKGFSLPPTWIEHVPYGLQPYALPTELRELKTIRKFNFMSHKLSKTFDIELLTLYVPKPNLLHYYQ